jgi:hypothetical protein
MDWLSDLFGWAVGEAIEDSIVGSITNSRRRKRRVDRRRLAAFDAGKVVGVPCASDFPRPVGGPWRPGTLGLRPDEAFWYPRRANAPELRLTRPDAVGESARINRNRVVLTYRVGEHTVRLQVRVVDVEMVSLVLDIPPLMEQQRFGRIG